MLNSSESFAVFQQCVEQYHVTDNVDATISNPFGQNDFRHLLFEKNRIDTVQWHLEDIIRNPQIDAVEALVIKRRIDKSNQDRTDVVEQIDEMIQKQLISVALLPNASVNTETPGWAIDRLSILALKIYHMQAECNRTDADEKHIEACSHKLAVLNEQKKDLLLSIDILLSDLFEGRKQMKLYRQMKMYNDPNLNPVLYNKVGEAK